MKRIFPLFPIFALVLSACGPRESSSSAPDAESGKAKAPGPLPGAAQIGPEVGAFAKELKGELVVAMQAGGPANAISVCSEKAQELAAVHSEHTGWTIRRTALRLRNPKNTPDDWEREVLENFGKRMADGADPATLVAYEVVDGQARFAKAIPTGKPCLICHGPDIAPEVADTLAKLYPGDKATGFEAGQLRGIFSVTASGPKAEK